MANVLPLRAVTRRQVDALHPRIKGIPEMTKRLEVPVERRGLVPRHRPLIPAQSPGQDAVMDLFREGWLSLT
ncbi:MAG: hypothetical protein WD871_05860, partial [Xanthobacteraceae bacterium]